MTLNNHKQTVSHLTFTALMAAAMCILGPMSVPIGAIPISLTNLVICLAAWVLGPRLGAASVAVYLMLGAVGLPVFSGYAGGLAKLLGPTGSYLIGFIAQAAIGGWAVEHSHGRPLWSGLGMAAGIAVCYAFGTAWFMVQMGCTLAYALGVCVVPFIPFDLVKVVISSGVGSVLRSRLIQAGLLNRNL